MAGNEIAAKPAARNVTLREKSVVYSVARRASQAWDGGNGLTVNKPCRYP